MAEVAAAPATSETTAAIQNLVAALPGVATSVITSKATEASAKLQAEAAKSQAKAAQAVAAAEAAKTQGIMANLKAQSPWLVPVLLAGAGIGAYFLFFRKKSG